MNPSTILPTKHGEFEITYYSDGKQEAVTMRMGDITQDNPIVRIHSSCLFSEALEAVDCDCKLQLNETLRQISEHGRGIIVYIYQEGRGVGLANKIRAVETMRTEKCDTADAFIKLNFELDPRSYKLCLAALEDQKTSKTIRLASNNPRKHSALSDEGYTITEKINLSYKTNAITGEYLRSKAEKLGHDIPWTEIKIVA